MVGTSGFSLFWGAKWREMELTGGEWWLMVAPSGDEWGIRTGSGMFLGEYQHTLDGKGRIILPAKFRDPLQGGAVIAKNGDNGLAVWEPERWSEVASEVREIAKRGNRERQAARLYFAGASEVNVDRQGRVAIPQHLREYAGLERDVIVTGAFDRIELWDAERWAEKNVEGEAAIAEGEGLPEFGI